MTFHQDARDVIASRGSSGTRTVYTANLDRWLAYCDEHKVDPEKPALADAVAFRDHLQGALKPATVRQVLASLSGIYGKLVAQEKATRNPFHPDALPWPSAADFAKTEALPEDLTAKMIEACEISIRSNDEEHPWKERLRLGGVRDAAILHLLHATGLRRASVAKMERRNLRRRVDGLHVVVTVKGGKEKEVAVPLEAAAALDRWLEAASKSAYVFPGKVAGTPICLDLINKIVKSRAKQAGAEGAHPHQLRAAFITEALDAGVPLNEVQASVHHADPKTTQRYDGKLRGAGVTAAVEAYRKGKR